MLDKIVIGAANFAQPYGILSSGDALTAKTVEKIVAMAAENQITAFDTALAYGPLPTALREQPRRFRISTKFSVTDDLNVVLDTLRGHPYDTLLIHDPGKLNDQTAVRALDFFADIRGKKLVRKIGVSIYSPAELDNVLRYFQPQVVQLPLNPWNTLCAGAPFQRLLVEKHIHVQARSLFLQGVLLAESLPEKLALLDAPWKAFSQTCDAFPSRLHALLSWANSHAWVNEWVLGVSTLKDLQEIIRATKSLREFQRPAPTFAPLDTPDFQRAADPRNWSK